MSIKILINAIDPEECRVAKVKANKLEEFYIESAAREITIKASSRESNPASRRFL
jgi:ribonuclease E